MWDIYSVLQSQNLTLVSQLPVVRMVSSDEMQAVEVDAQRHQHAISQTLLHTPCVNNAHLLDVGNKPQLPQMLDAYVVLQWV